MHSTKTTMVGHGMLNDLVAAFLFSLQGTRFGQGDPQV